MVYDRDAITPSREWEKAKSKTHRKAHFYDTNDRHSSTKRAWCDSSESRENWNISNVMPNMCNEKANMGSISRNRKSKKSHNTSTEKVTLEIDTQTTEKRVKDMKS